jgi:ligand-binding sensor domain-containing protein
MLFAQKHPVTPITQYNIRTWSTNDGLPNDKITAVYQSAQGYIWLASQEGLVRFDGASFEIFDKKNTPVFPHSQVTALVEDKDSTLWINTIRGVLKYRHGIFEAVQTESDVEPFIGTTLFLDRKGNCLVGTRSGILRVVNGALSNFAAAGKLALGSVTAMCDDTDDELWIGTAQGLKLFSEGRVKQVANGIPGGAEISSLCLNQDQTLWVGTPEGLYFSKPGHPRKFERSGALAGKIIRS